MTRMNTKLFFLVLLFTAVIQANPIDPYAQNVFSEVYVDSTGFWSIEVVPNSGMEWELNESFPCSVSFNLEISSSKISVPVKVYVENGVGILQKDYCLGKTDERSPDINPAKDTITLTYTDSSGYSHTWSVKLLDIPAGMSFCTCHGWGNFVSTTPTIGSPNDQSDTCVYEMYFNVPELNQGYEDLHIYTLSRAHYMSPSRIDAATMRKPDDQGRVNFVFSPCERKQYVVCDGPVDDDVRYDSIPGKSHDFSLSYRYSPEVIHDTIQLDFPVYSSAKTASKPENHTGNRVTFSGATFSGKTVYLVKANPGQAFSGTIRIYAASGKLLQTLPVRLNAGGTGIVHWNYRDLHNRAIADGTYLSVLYSQNRVVNQMVTTKQ